MKKLLALLAAALAVLPAHANTLTVTNNADSGAGSLRQAIASANSGDTITFAPALNGQKILLTSGQLSVTKNVTILGPGPNQLAIDGNHAGRVFYLSPGLTNFILGLTITNGHAGGYGGGIYNDHAVLTVSNSTLTGNSTDNSGGGIYSDGNSYGNATLTIQNCTITGNSATPSGSGGGIYNTGSYGSATLTVQNSTLSSNSATFSGGGIVNQGGAGNATLTIQGSTLSGNSAGDTGGGISNDGTSSGNATLTIHNSTLSGNSARYYTGGIFNWGYSGRVTMTVKHTLLANGHPNTVTIDGTVTNLGFNLSDNLYPNSLATTVSNLLLGPLANNGGPTFTHALLPGSPANNAGDPTFTGPPDTDQRGSGFPRIVGGTVDIGAFESPFVPTTTTLTSLPNPSVFGQSVTLTATVTAQAGTATGDVTFSDGAASLGSASLVGGTATLTTSSLEVATHSITVVYPGNGNFLASTSSVTSQVVNKVDTSTALVSSANPSVFGQPVKFTATVSATAPGAGLPTGIAEFYDGITSLGTGILSGGSATLTNSSLSVATHSITVVYSGDGNFLTSTGAVSQVVNKAATTATLSLVTAGPFFPGQKLTATYLVSPVAPGAGVPGGTVTLTNELSSVAGTAPSDSVMLLLTDVGTFHFGAEYSGDTSFLPSSSSLVLSRTVLSMTDPSMFFASAVDHTSTRFLQTTLMQQTLTITNITGQTLDAIRVTIHLSAFEKSKNIRVYNASGTNSAGEPYLQHNFPVLPGDHVTFTVEYYSPDRVTVPNPMFTVELVTPETLVAPPGTSQEVLRKAALSSDNAFLIDFATVKNAHYYIIYSSDLLHWSVAQPWVLGTGFVVQWVDNGPPKTESHPSMVPHRFYIVLKAN